NSLDTSELDKSLGVAVKPLDQHAAYGQLNSKPDGFQPSVYITKIMPSTNEHLEAGTLTEKPSHSDELSFGIIHTSPDDGDDDAEEFVDSRSIQKPRKN